MAADLPTAWGVRDNRLDSAAGEKEIKLRVGGTSAGKWSFTGVVVVFSGVSTQLVVCPSDPIHLGRKVAKREIALPGYDPNSNRSTLPKTVSTLLYNTKKTHRTGRNCSRTHI